MHTQFHTTQA